MVFKRGTYVFPVRLVVLRRRGTDLLLNDPFKAPISPTLDRPIPLLFFARNVDMPNTSATEPRVDSQPITLRTRSMQIRIWGTDCDNFTSVAHANERRITLRSVLFSVDGADGLIPAIMWLSAYPGNFSIVTI